MVSQGGDDRVVTLPGTDLPYRILLDQMYAGAVTMTPDGIIGYCNQRFAEIVRTPPARMLGSALRRFAVPEERPVLAELLGRGRQASVRGELLFRAADGTPVPVAITPAPLRLPGIAEVIGVIGVVVDTTERRQQEELRNHLIDQVMTAQDEERRRIARELHDETGQSLTALLVGLRTLEGTRTIARAVSLAKRLREMAALTLIDVGRLARGLHPSVLDDLGLSAAVTRLVQEFGEVHGIAAEARVDALGTVPLSPLVQSTVYRMLQEALTNVARHADARNVRVALERKASTVELQVEDDGIGFNPEVKTSRTGTAGRVHLGIQGMRERAALLGGSVVVDSRLGSGTTITARLPLQGGALPAAKRVPAHTGRSR
jgi:PAS domain S-box-containing protein